MNDFGLGSLDQVALATNIEDEFDVQIADEDAERMRTVGYVLQYLDKVNAGG